MVTFNWTCPVMVHVFFVFKDVAAIVGTTTQYCASKPKEKKKKTDFTGTREDKTWIKILYNCITSLKHARVQIKTGNTSQMYGHISHNHLYIDTSFK